MGSPKIAKIKCLGKIPVIQYSVFLPHVQLARHNVATIWQKMMMYKITNLDFVHTNEPPPPPTEIGKEFKKKRFQKIKKIKDSKIQKKKKKIKKIKKKLKIKIKIKSKSYNFSYLNSPTLHTYSLRFALVRSRLGLPP